MKLIFFMMILMGIFFSPAHADELEGDIAPSKTKHIQAYQLARPNMGLELDASLAALGTKNIPAFGEHETIKAFGMSFEYQPSFLQSIGVLGIGPTVTIYPIFADNPITSSVASLWSFGGKISYQARFFREQPIVPVAGFQTELLAYHFNTPPLNSTVVPTGRLWVSGPFFGAWLLMNLFSPSDAADFYYTHGVSRSYLVAEGRLLSGSDANLAISGASFFFGLRIEF